VDPANSSAGDDPERPSAARIYDYYLGGSHNFAIDRAVADQAIALLPQLPANMRANRAFLRRAVRFLLDSGIRQFLDLGSGIPTVGNVHEVAHSVDSASRVVYVDNDPVAVAHSQSILESQKNAVVVPADIRDPSAVLDHPLTRSLINFDEPVGVLAVAVLHFVPASDDPATIIGQYADSLVPGSGLVISHGTSDQQGDLGARMEALYKRTANPILSRTKPEVVDLFNGFELVEPGVVFVPLWRPDSEQEPPTAPERTATYAGVGIVRSP
jgi:hypothetical protein